MCDQIPRQIMTSVKLKTGSVKYYFQDLHLIIVSGIQRTESQCNSNDIVFIIHPISVHNCCSQAYLGCKVSWLECIVAGSATSTWVKLRMVLKSTIIFFLVVFEYPDFSVWYILIRSQVLIVLSTLWVMDSAYAQVPVVTSSSSITLIVKDYRIIIIIFPKNWCCREGTRRCFPHLKCSWCKRVVCREWSSSSEFYVEFWSSLLILCLGGISCSDRPLFKVYIVVYTCSILNIDWWREFIRDHPIIRSCRILSKNYVDCLIEFSLSHQVYSSILNVIPDNKTNLLLRKIVSLWDLRPSDIMDS